MSDKAYTTEDYNPTIKDWIAESGNPASLVVFDSTGAILNTTAMVFTQSLPPGIYPASLTISDTSDELLLIGTHSMWIGKDDTEFKQYYRQVTDFPEQWEPCVENGDLYLPPGEYCRTTEGLYRRKAVQDG